MTDKQNLLCTYSGILLTLKKKKILVHAMPWMNFDASMVNDQSRMQNDKQNFIYMRHLD